MIRLLEAFDHEQGSRSRAIPPIGVLQRHCADTDSTCPEPSQLTCPADVFGRIPDPRRVRGRRCRLGSLLTLCMLAVLGAGTHSCDLSSATRLDTAGLSHPPAML
ncbi:hypothetical protein OK006_8295 [Actinobacteria bacterium OK006]|nr:hypothetical protein OK006_8295 [Actinobacteria bacterium OK006]